jgi:ubiquinone biosynthesis protein
MVRIIYDKEFFNRTKEIVKILTEFGFGYLVEKIELKHRLPLKYRIKKYDSIEEFDSSMPIRLRLILEELGSTYIKFGQILSTREDLIKKEFIDELSKLQDNTPEFSYEITKKIIETELKKPVDEIFSKIDKKPIASASIGQVHRGTLKTGEEVVVKYKNLILMNKLLMI